MYRTAINKITSKIESLKYNQIKGSIACCRLALYGILVFGV